MADVDSAITEQDFSVKLVESLRKHPCLYNYKLAEYSKKEVTEKAWETVAREVNETVPLCKAKWKNIRTVFVRKIKPVLNGTPGRARRPYYLNKEMKFLLPFLKPVLNSPPNAQTQSQLQAIDSALDEEDDNFEEYINLVKGVEEEIEMQEESITNAVTVQQQTNEILTNKGRKRKADILDNDSSINEFNSYPTHEEDYKKMFLLSLLPELHLMSDQHMRQFKRRVLKLIDDIMEHRPSSALSATSSFNVEGETHGDTFQTSKIKYELTDEY